ncbi:tRNA (guanine(37)-N1)-methyltransferase Trm5b [uncultured archaeon]|nr:tRNA (guanine(37)-N1)-methyltransferase Trm5b [uncultured archaeon]
MLKKVFKVSSSYNSMRIPLDVVGDIAILKFARWHPWILKKFYARRFLKNNRHIKVILEKTSGFSGELRVQETKWVAGEKRKDTIHKENDCSFYLNVDETYFSPRLSQERKVVAEEIFASKLRSPSVLVMFGGVAPQAIVLAKLFKKNKLSIEIISSELNKKACEFAEKNVEMNKVQDYVQVVCGDSRKFCVNSASRKKDKFDFILMLRPNLEDTFLDAALKVAKKGTLIYYHGFGEEEKVRNEIERDLKKFGKKYKITEFRKAGDIGVKKFRWNVKIKID